MDLILITDSGNIDQVLMFKNPEKAAAAAAMLRTAYDVDPELDDEDAAVRHFSNLDFFDEVDLAEYLNLEIDA